MVCARWIVCRARREAFGVARSPDAIIAEIPNSIENSRLAYTYNLSCTLELFVRRQRLGRVGGRFILFMRECVAAGLELLISNLQLGSVVDANPQILGSYGRYHAGKLRGVRRAHGHRVATHERTALTVQHLALDEDFVLDRLGGLLAIRRSWMSSLSSFARASREGILLSRIDQINNPQSRPLRAEC